MRISLVCRQGVLGLEPKAAFKDWDGAEEFCACSDVNWEDGTGSDLSIVSLIVDEYLGMSIEDVDDPERIEEQRTYDDEDPSDDEDEDYDD